MSALLTIKQPASSAPALGPRVDALDLLRGVAILGIFLMNTQSMLLPSESYWNPDLHMVGQQTKVTGDFAGKNAIAYIFTHLFADVKFISIFSVMFGAGIMLQGERVAHRGMSPALIHYRRMGVLLVIALIHAYLIWYGDILTEYAMCGILLFPLRKLNPVLLMGIGVFFIALGFLLIVAKYSYVSVEELQNETATTALSGESYDNGEARSGDFSQIFPLNIANVFAAKIDEQFKTTDRDGNPIALTEADAFTGDRVRTLKGDDGAIIETHEPVFWRDEIKFRTLCSFLSQAYEFPKWSLWRCGGCILIGMALQCWRFFHGSWGKPAYWTIALFCIPCGMAITGLGIAYNHYVGHWNDPILHKHGQLFNYVGSFIQALGYMCAGVLVAMRIAEPAKDGIAGYFVRILKHVVVPIRSVGKMALTNYLFQSIVGTTLAYGHRVSEDAWLGFAWYGKVERYRLLWIVLCVWAVQLLLSTLWVRHFRQGPVEWLWHKLVYFGRTYPLRPSEISPLT